MSLVDLFPMQAAIVALEVVDFGSPTCDSQHERLHLIVNLHCLVSGLSWLVLFAAQVGQLAAQLSEL